MNDKAILQWIYLRMQHFHHEDPNVDYMRRFREIIDKMNKD